MLSSQRTSTSKYIVMSKDMHKCKQLDITTGLPSLDGHGNESEDCMLHKVNITARIQRIPAKQEWVDAVSQRTTGHTKNSQRLYAAKGQHR